MINEKVRYHLKEVQDTLNEGAALLDITRQRLCEYLYGLDTPKEKMLGDLQFCSSALHEIDVNGRMDGDISEFARTLLGCSPIDIGNIVHVDVEIF